MTDKYKIAQEVWEEWERRAMSAPYFYEDWLKDKTKPKDPLFEKSLELGARICGHFDLGVIPTEWLVSNIKEIFKDELNGTRGLDEAIEYGKAFGYTNIEHLKKIKERLETKK